MAKLFSKEDFKEVEIGAIVNYEEENTKSLQDEINTLANESLKLSTSYLSIQALKENIEESNYTFVTESNYQEINKYIENICKNINYPAKSLQINLENFSNVSLASEIKVISLEGFLADLWAKIKAIFTKIYEKIKEFFKRYFTRFGRVKGKLENIYKVLNEVESKGLKQNILDNAPSSLVNKFGIEGTITFNVIETLCSNTFSLNDNLINIISKLDPLAKTPIISSERVAELKKLKEEIAKNKQTLSDLNKAKEEKENEKGEKLFGLMKSETQKAEIGSLKNAISEKEKDIENKSTKVNETESILKSPSKELTEEDKEDIMNKYLQELNKSILDLSKKVDGAILVNCKKVKIKDNAKEDDFDIIELDDENKEGQASLVLGTKDALKKLVKEALDHIKDSETTMNKMLSIQDNVFKNIDNVDKIIKILDVEDKEEKFKKYKSYLNNSVKPKLMTYKNAVLVTSKMLNSFKTLELDACEGIADYSVISMKYFA